MREMWSKSNTLLRQPEGQAPSEEWVYVTPEIAEKWLQNNEGNRRLVVNRVMQFATDMEAGRWVDRHPHGISFDENGRLLDGQHRLHAVAVSGVPVMMRCTFGLATEMESMFDLGAPRHTGEVMRRAGITDPNNMSALISTLYWYDNFPDRAWSGLGYPSKTWILEQAQRDHEALGETVRIAQSAWTARRVPRPSYGVTRILAQRAGLDEMWDDWNDGITSGAGLRHGDPRLAVINYFGHSSRKGERAGRLERQKAVGMLLKSLIAYREGKQIKTLRFEMTSLPMPTI
jgi:hypothetical protein